MTDPTLTLAEELIRRFEGCVLTPYRCPAGAWSIGYGNRYLIDDTPVTSYTKRLTPGQAEALLVHTLSKLQLDFRPLVTTSLNAHEEAALLDFTYNIGITAFTNSTLLKLLNNGCHKEAADEFAKWIYADGKILQGLVKRREIERRLFITPISS